LSVLGTWRHVRHHWPLSYDPALWSVVFPLGIGPETARRARAEGTDVILAGRNPDRLQHAAAGPGAVRSGWPLA
jgi:hypothetical protein